jgi:ABC-type phosphate/phosphonate transport system permease subunit
MAATADLFETTLALRRRQRLAHLAVSAGILLVIAWCVNATVIADTDWSRIGGGLGIFRGVARFFAINFALVPQLVEPAIETFMMATLGTLLGLYLRHSGRLVRRVQRHAKPHPDLSARPLPDGAQPLGP